MTQYIETADGVRIALDVAGAGEPALVFVHGWCCSRTHWAAQMSAFSERHQVVAVDLGGHGDSEGGREAWTVESFSRDVATVVGELGLERAILVGHSMGGAVISGAAERLGDRVIGLVGADTFQQLAQVRTRQQVEDRVAPFIRKRFRDVAKPFARSMFIDLSDPELVERTVEGMAATPERVAIDALTSFSLVTPLLQQQLLAMTIPVMTINASSQNSNVKAAEAHGVGVRFMDGVGHFVMMEDPETFNRLLEKAVADICAFESPAGS